ncbi:MAG: DUF58 domain-containing protein [Proteobacteria bacterium]|nr:DUF58 domain-containing protein [Pseudomonadota bacterium]
MDERFEQFSPNFLKKLQRLKIHSRRNFLGSRQGSHITNRRGQGLEFADFKQYVAGDDFRYIDWGLYARSDRLYVKQFRSEENLNVLILFDNSLSMNFPSGENKLTAAKRLALAIGYITLANGDSLSVFPLCSENIFSINGVQNLQPLFRYLAEIKNQEILDLSQATTKAISKTRYSGKCFIISDFLMEQDELFRSLDILRAKNFELTLLQVLTKEEINPSYQGTRRFIDSETKETVELTFTQQTKQDYTKLLNHHLDSIKFYCNKSGISHLLVSSEEDISNVLLSRFAKVGILR